MVILVAGRGPTTVGFGLEDAGVQLTGRGGIAVDDSCQAREGRRAAGDVTGVALFTHVATYQGRVVTDNILGRDHRACCEGIPRVVFADPRSPRRPDRRPRSASPTPSTGPGPRSADRGVLAGARAALPLGEG